MINKINEQVRHLWNNRHYNNYNQYVQIESFCYYDHKSEFIYDCIIYCLYKDLDHKLFISLIKPEYNDTMISKIVEILENSKPEEISNKINLLIIES